MIDQPKTPFGTGVQRFSAPRPRLLQLDFLLLLATFGLIAFSLVTLGGPISREPGGTDYVPRQLAYAVLCRRRFPADDGPSGWRANVESK